MGNYKFRLSDMMPNAWFYKLRDIGNGKAKPKPRNNTLTTKKKHVPSPPPQQPQFTNHRHSYYFTSDPIKSDKLYNSPINPKSTDVHFPDPPRKSSKTRRRTRRRSNSNILNSPSSVVTTKNVSSTVSAGCGCRAILDSTPDYSPDSSPEVTLPSLSSSCSCRVSSSPTDIIIDVDSRKSSVSPPKFHKFDDFDPISSIELPPILTKPAKFNDMVSEIKNRNPERPQSRLRRDTVKSERKVVTSYHPVKEETMKTKSSIQIRRNSPNSPGLKLRANSPKIASKKIQAHNRKSMTSTRRNLSDSFAIVKTSFDPQREFRESMVEMIVENNIRASKDLEELLACYLSLNSNEYHDIIIKVFEQIWFDLTDIQL